MNILSKFYEAFDKDTRPIGFVCILIGVLAVPVAMGVLCHSFGVWLITFGVMVGIPPRIVVNMPANAKQLADLPVADVPEDMPRTIEGSRAVLWWTVYNASVEALKDDDGQVWASDITSAVSAADRAVDKAYGPIKP